VCDFLQLNVTSFHLWSIILLNILFLSSSVFLKKITECVQFSVRYVQLKLSCSIALAVQMVHVHVGLGYLLADIVQNSAFDWVNS
jgi:hypothetical protein